MVQVKKAFVRQAILDSAYELFSERGYHRTTLQDIARASRASASAASIPISRRSFTCSMRSSSRGRRMRSNGSKSACARSSDPRDRLRAILLGIWREMPMENIGLANSLMEALASADPNQKKPVPLLKWTEERLMTMLKPCCPDGRRVDQL